MRLLRRRRQPPPFGADNAVPPTYGSIGEFVGHALRFPENGWFEALPGGASSRSVGTVDRCLQLNAQQIAAMPLRYRHTESTQGYEPLWVHDPCAAWYPNGIHDAMFAVVWSIYARGEAFLWVTTKYESGYPRTWTVLDPTTIKVREVAGTRAYWSNDVPLDPRDVLQIMRNPNGALRGTSALEAYASNVASASAAENYAADVYYSTGASRVALKSQRRLDQAQAQQIQADWVAAAAKRFGAPAILPPDLELLEAISVSPKDMMLLDSRDWDVRQIAAAFGVPAILLNTSVSGGLTYQNPEQLFGLWWRTELMPCAAKIAEALSRWLPRGSWVEFDPWQVLRPDMATLTTLVIQAVGAELLTVDEARALVFDLPPLREGEADQAAAYYEEAGTHGATDADPRLSDAVFEEAMNA